MAEQAVNQDQVVQEQSTQEAQPAEQAVVAQQNINVSLTVNGEKVSPERVLETIRDLYSQALGKIKEDAAEIETAVTTKVDEIDADVAKVEQEAAGLWEQHGKSICFVTGMLAMLVVVLTSAAVARF